MLRVLSLGAGVQSSTVLCMSCDGVLPKLDAAIFADTQWEPKAVYQWLGWLGAKAEAASIPILTVSKGNLRADALRSRMRSDEHKQMEGGRWASMPLYTHLKGQATKGQIRRQCTKEYKIEPITKKLRELSNGQPAELWFGISGDELRRVRMSKVRWITNYYPLIFGLDRPYHRRDCLAWMAKQGYPAPPRSACIGCPYHSDAEWRFIKADPEQWDDAVSFDAGIRRVCGLTAETYLHRSCKPLPMIDFETLEDKGQQNWIHECEGMCGV